MAKEVIDGEFHSAVPPHKALRWFFDFHANDHSDPRFQALWGKPKPGDGRAGITIKGNEATFTDTFGGRATKFTIRNEGTALVAHGIGQGYTSEGRLAFEPHGQGSRIKEHLEIEGGAVMKIILKLMGFGPKILKDVGIHVQQMEAEWKRKPW